MKLWVVLLALEDHCPITLLEDALLEELLDDGDAVMSDLAFENVVIKLGAELLVNLLEMLKAPRSPELVVFIESPVRAFIHLLVYRLYLGLCLGTVEICVRAVDIARAEKGDAVSQRHAS